MSQPAASQQLRRAERRMGTALVDAARAAGIRLTLLDTVYLAGGLTGSPEAAGTPRSVVRRSWKYS